MTLILNISHSFIYSIFLFISVWGYGSLLKKQLKKNLNFGEIGIYGFIILYLILIIIHFIFPINYLIGISIKFIGFLIGLPIITRLLPITSDILVKY